MNLLNPGQSDEAKILFGDRSGTIEEVTFQFTTLAEKSNTKNIHMAKTLRRLSAIHTVALATNSTMELKNIFHNLLDITMKTLHSEICYILLHDVGRKRFQVYSHLDYAGKSTTLKEVPITQDSVSTWVFKSRKPILIRDMADNRQFNKKSVLGHEIKSLICVPLAVRDEIIGTMSVVNKVDQSTYYSEDMDWLTTIAAQASFAIKNAKLHEEQQKVYMNIVHVLASAITASDSYTRGHSERVTIYSTELAKKINLSRSRIDVVERAAILHDIGKIGIEDYLLNKEKELSAEEILKLREHPLIGMKMLEPLTFLNDVSICIGQHHERVDGQGYPFAIPAEKLLLESRILAIADAFDAMTSDRPYRKALSRQKAIKELVDNSGKQHDAHLVSHFVELVESGIFDSSLS